MWYGSASNPTECFGPTRYMWDLGLYLAATKTVVIVGDGMGLAGVVLE